MSIANNKEYLARLTLGQKLAANAVIVAQQNLVAVENEIDRIKCVIARMEILSGMVPGVRFAEN